MNVFLAKIAVSNSKLNMYPKSTGNEYLLHEYSLQSFVTECEQATVDVFDYCSSFDPFLTHMRHHRRPHIIKECVGTKRLQSGKPMFTLQERDIMQAIF